MHQTTPPIGRHKRIFVTDGVSFTGPQFVEIASRDTRWSSTTGKARDLLGFNPEGDSHLAQAATVEAYWALRA